MPDWVYRIAIFVLQYTKGPNIFCNRFFKCFACFYPPFYFTFEIVAKVWINDNIKIFEFCKAGYVFPFYNKNIVFPFFINLENKVSLTVGLRNKFAIFLIYDRELDCTEKTLLM